jgi:hypothetical protein
MSGVVENGHSNVGCLLACPVAPFIEFGSQFGGGVGCLIACHPNMGTHFVDGDGVLQSADLGQQLLSNVSEQRTVFATPESFGLVDGNSD